MKLSVCTDALFNGQPIETAISHVKAAGLSTIEFWSWKNKDLALLETLCHEEHIEIAALCTGFFDLVNASTVTLMLKR